MYNSVKMFVNYIKFTSVHCISTSLVLFLMIYLYNTSDIRNIRIMPIQEGSVRPKSPKAKSITDIPNQFSYKTLARKQREHYLQMDKETVYNDTIEVKYKYILLWTNPRKSPFSYLGNADTVFKKRNCEFTNCFVTSDREYLGHYTRFDVIAFNGPELIDIIGRDDIPKYRSSHQKYVYANIEAASTYPVCSTTWDKFFNWTWTYKLNSDAVWGYFLIKNATKHIIGPSADIQWMKEEDMLPISNEIKAELAGKHSAVAWYVSNCGTSGGREKFVAKFQRYLNDFDLSVDVFGDCGDFRCPKEKMNACLDSMQSNYYFYLAFENALSEDYVTEKILHALHHYTVPVVYGGANYSR